MYIRIMEKESQNVSISSCCAFILSVIGGATAAIPQKTTENFGPCM